VAAKRFEGGTGSPAVAGTKNGPILQNLRHCCCQKLRTKFCVTNWKEKILVCLAKSHKTIVSNASALKNASFF
jgi:hypothetical protein